jgi:hypothetical protein
MKINSITKLSGLTILISIISLGTISAFALSAFSTNFNVGSPSEFSGITTTEGVQGYSGLGTGGNVFSGDFLRNPSIPPQVTTLTLTGLPPHSSIDLKFLLAIIDSWDGNGCSAGPDSFNVKVDGSLIFSKVFENSFCGTQDYVPPAGVELARHLQLGFNTGNTFHKDSAYNMGLDPSFQSIPHTSSTLTVEWFASGPVWQGESDESWAIENVEVTLLGTTKAVVGGEILPIDMTSLFVAGTMTNAFWILPTAGGIAGAAMVLFKVRKNHSEPSLVPKKEDK